MSGIPEHFVLAIVRAGMAGDEQEFRSAVAALSDWLEKVGEGTLARAFRAALEGPC